MPRLDLSSIDPECAELVGRIENAGARIFIFDARNETRVPCFMGLIVDTERLGLWRGYGAHSRQAHCTDAGNLRGGANPCDPHGRRKG